MIAISGSLLPRLRFAVVALVAEALLAPAAGCGGTKKRKGKKCIEIICTPNKLKK